MSKIMLAIDNWPHTKSKQPIFKSTDDAIFYGALISRHKREIEALKICRLEAYRQIDMEKTREAPNLQRMCFLAVKAQFFREAYEEAERIDKYDNSIKEPVTVGYEQFSLLDK